MSTDQWFRTKNRLTDEQLDASFPLDNFKIFHKGEIKTQSQQVVTYADTIKLFSSELTEEKRQAAGEYRKEHGKCFFCQKKECKGECEG